MDIFGAGERLGEPAGDPAREAVAALRGFAYQLHASALAWLALADGETIHLEVAEDYAVAAGRALEGVQVKDTAGSGALTIRSAAASATIDSLVDLAARNPNRRVSIRHLTTSPIGRERALEDRIEDGPALAYWRQAAAGAPLAPLRSVLMRLPLASATREFILERDDGCLRDDLVRRIHWDAGQASFQELAADLEAGAIEFASSALRLGADVGRRLAAAAVARVLQVAAKPGRRRLRRADLLTLADALGRVSLPQAAMEALLGGTAGAGTREPLLLPGEPEPAGGPVADRAKMLAGIDALADGHSFAVVTGSTGMGKTHAASRVATARRGPWLVGDLRRLDAAAAAARLRAMLGEAAVSPATTILLDDLDRMDEPAVRAAVARLVAAMRRRDGAVIATCATPPSRRALDAICGSADVVAEVPYLTTAEVGDLVEQAGGARGMANLVHLAGSSGHPQLVQAAILHMRSAGWSRGAVKALLGGEAEDMHDERRAARDRLVAAMPEAARTLLLRTSMVMGRFGRDLALALADVEPRLANPGLELDRLVGPWIERSGRDRLRVSPLLDNAGLEALSPAEQGRVHRAVADHHLGSGEISVAQSDAVLVHALAGRDHQQIFAYANSLATADTETLELLARHSPAIFALSTDRPIVTGEPLLNAMLRLGQLMVALAGENHGRAGEVWRAMRGEMAAVEPAGFEVIVLSKILIAAHVAAAIPEWLDLLIRFDAMCEEDPQLRGAFEEVARSERRRLPGDVQGLAFINQATHLGSTAALRTCLERLDNVDTDVRGRLFSGMRGGLGHFGHLVDSAWIASVKGDGFDGEAAAADYLAMAVLAKRWGESELAARCHAVRAMMIDEQVGDRVRALEALRDAETAVGASPSISRARAKVHWRSRDHATALPELEAYWDDPRTAGDAVERGFVAREAGISAAETGRWAEARTWFERARDAFPAIAAPSIPAMRIGLGADAAQAAFKAGDGAAAIAGYARAIDEVAKLDPRSSLAARYLHRVIRHAALWLMANARAEPMDLGDVGALPPGACSNPDPSEAILERPLGPLDLARYLVASAALDLGVVGHFDGLHGRLSEGPILGLEIARSKQAADHAVASGDPDRLVAALAPHAAAATHLRDHREALEKGDIMDPARGMPPPQPLDGTGPEAARAAALDLLLSFGTLRAIEGDKQAIGRVRAVLDDPGLAGLRTAARLMVGAEGRARDMAEAVARSVAEVAAAGGAPVDPDRALAATVRFTLRTPGSEFKDLLAPALARWTGRTWRGILDHHRFRLRSPHANAQAIEDALASAREGLAFSAGVALAAAPAVRTSMQGMVREALTRLRDA